MGVHTPSLAPEAHERGNSMKQFKAYGFRLAVLSSFVLVLAAPLRWFV
jgi:hypothetical protein